MAYVSAKCPECGGAIKLDNKMESGFCMYCGTKVYLREAIPQKVKVEGVATLEVKLKNAEAYIKLGEEEKALSLLEQITEEFTSDCRAWWMLAKLKYSYTYKCCNKVTCLSDQIEESKEFQYAMTLADEEMEQKIIQEYSEYLATIDAYNTASQEKIKATLNGDYSYLNHSHNLCSGFEVIDNELYYYKFRKIFSDKVPTYDLGIDKVDVRTLHIASIHEGYITMSNDNVYIMSETTPEEYGQFCKIQEEQKKRKLFDNIRIVVGIVSLMFFIFVFLGWIKL